MTSFLRSSVPTNSKGPLCQSQNRSPNNHVNLPPQPFSPTGQRKSGRETITFALYAGRTSTYRLTTYFQSTCLRVLLALRLWYARPVENCLQCPLRHHMISMMRNRDGLTRLGMNPNVMTAADMIQHITTPPKILFCFLCCQRLHA